MEDIRMLDAVLERCNRYDYIGRIYKGSKKKSFYRVLLTPITSAREYLLSLVRTLPFLKGAGNGQKRAEKKA